jgi:hypothetical protein
LRGQPPEVEELPHRKTCACRQLKADISAVGIQPQLASVLELEASDAAAPDTFLHERELFFKRNSRYTLAAAGREGKCMQEGNKNTLLRKNHTIKK